MSIGVPSRSSRLRQRLDGKAELDCPPLRRIAIRTPAFGSLADCRKERPLDDSRDSTQS